MNASEGEIVGDIRAIVLRYNPFWGYLLAQTPVRVMKTVVGTSFTDGKRIVLHRAQVTDKRTAAKILLHELAHIAYMHVARRKETYSKVIGEDVPPIVANLGEDVVANAAVVDVFGEEIDGAAVRVPEGTRGKYAVIHIANRKIRIDFPKEIGEMSTEEIVKAVWEKLKEEFPEGQERGQGENQREGDGKSEEQDQGKGQDREQGQDGGQGKQGIEVDGWTDDHSKHGEMSDADVDDVRQRIQKAIEHAQQYDRDYVPAGIEQVVEAMKPKIRIDWQRFTKKWIRETWGMDDYTWKRPNKRKMAVTGVYLPRTVGYRGEAWIVLDTSGSMGGENIQKALGAIQKGMINNGIDVANVVQVDAEVERVERVRAKDLKKHEIVGFGGTVLRKGLEYAVKKGAKGVIVITDGYTDRDDFEGFKVPILAMVVDENGYEALAQRVQGMGNVKVVYVR